MMKIPKKALHLIPEFEGWSSTAYWDPYGHVWTIGYGFTHNVHAGQHMTRAEGNKRLEQELITWYAPSIENLHVHLNENQFSALLSFVWNLGPGSMQWDVGRSLREGKYEQAANEMLQYDRVGGVVLAGLTARRERERALFLTPVPHKTNLYDVLYPNERAAVDKYLSLKKHPTINILKINSVRKQIQFMIEDIGYAAEHGHLKNGRKVSKGWNINNRRKRFTTLFNLIH